MIEIAPKSAEIKSNWADARLYCFALNIDGKIGWRLPTKKELKTYITGLVSHAPILVHGFKNLTDIVINSQPTSSPQIGLDQYAI